MSIILKGIDLPTGVYRVFVVIEGENEETLYRNTVEYEEEALKAVIQIPKGHGNIIDESKAVVTETIDGYYEITAPTILEGEE